MGFFRRFFIRERNSVAFRTDEPIQEARIEAQEPKDIPVFVDSLVQKAGFSKLPAEFLTEQKERLIVEVQRRIGIEMVKLLKEQDIPAFERLMEQKAQDPVAIRRFFEERIPDLGRRTQQILNQFEDEFIGDMKHMMESS